MDLKRKYGGKREGDTAETQHRSPTGGDAPGRLDRLRRLIAQGRMPGGQLHGPSPEQLVEAVRKARALVEPALSVAVARFGPQLQGLLKVSERVPVIGPQLASAFRIETPADVDDYAGSEAIPEGSEAFSSRFAAERVQEAKPAAVSADAHDVQEAPVDDAPAYAEPLRAPEAAVVPRAEEASDAGEVVSEPAEAGPKSAHFVLKPIRTRTMARLLAAQGHRDRALAIYAEIVAQKPEDRDLREEADAVRRGQRLERPQTDAAKTPFTFDASMPTDDEDTMRWEQLSPEGDSGEAQHDGGRIGVRWRVSEQGERRARAVLGETGELAVRIIAVGYDPERGVRSEVTEHWPVESSGSWTHRVLTSGLRSFAAVGLRAGQRFVAIAHAAREASPAEGPATNRG